MLNIVNVSKPDWVQKDSEKKKISEKLDCKVCVNVPLHTS